MNRQVLNYLRDNGYTEQFNQAMTNFLFSKGFSGQLNKSWYDYLGSLGYTGQFSERLKMWSYSGDTSQTFSFLSGGTGYQSITATRASNATMVDSDGKLKWAPHNLAPDSANLQGLGWVPVRATPEGGSLLREDTTAENNHYIRENAGRSSYVLGQKYTIEFKVKRGLGVRNLILASGNSNIINLSGVNAVKVDLGTGTFHSSGPDDTIEPSGDGFYLVKIRRTIGLSGGTQLYLFMANDVFSRFYDGDGVSTIELKDYAVYRSDLGGMVNNPATGNSYVPTGETAVFLPRTGHHVWDGSEWVDTGLLSEPAATNKFLYTDISNDYWSISGATKAGSMITLTHTTGAVSAGVTLLENQNYTATFEVSQCSTPWVVLRVINFGGLEVRAWFNTTTGQIGEVLNGVVPPVVQQVGPGRWRFSITFDTSYDGDGRIYIYPTSNNGSFGAVVGATMTLDGIPQVEAGVVPTTPIPTAGAEVTRAADVVTIPPAALQLPDNQTPISIEMEGTISYADTDKLEEMIFYRWRKASIDYLQVHMETVGTRTGQVKFTQRETNSGLDGVVSGNNALSPGLNVPFNIAARHGATFIGGALDGVSFGENASPTAMVDLTGVSLELAPVGSMTIKSVKITYADIGEAGLVEATA